MWLACLPIEYAICFQYSVTITYNVTPSTSVVINIHLLIGLLWVRQLNITILKYVYNVILCVCAFTI